MALFSPIDAVALTSLLAQAGVWLDEVTRRTKRKALCAGQTLYYLGTTVAALETLENELRGLLVPLTRFDETWRIEERAQAFHDISAWVQDFTIVGILDRNLPALEDALEHVRDAGFDRDDAVGMALIATLQVAAHDLSALRDTGELGRTEIIMWPELRQFWRAMRDARTPEDADEVIRVARRVLWMGEGHGPTDPRTAYVLPQAFGKARAQTLRAHPSLPRPTWSDPLA